MTFCLNPHCQKPQNPDDAKRCSSCGSKLLLKARYRPLQPIGHSGSRTFLAIDERKRSKPQCVIQQVFPQNKAQEDLALFSQTASLLAELGKHPQIPELLAFCEQHDRQYFVYEFIEGLNLAQVLAKESTYAEPEIKQLLDELLPILQLFHEKQLIHGDIKPANIIRRTRDEFTEDDNQPLYVLVGFDGATGTHIANSAYTAPEQAKGFPCIASDLYGLGVTCLYLLTQIHPLELLDSREDLWVWQDYLRHEIDKPMRRAIDKLVQRSIANRYQSAAEVIQAIDPNFKPPAFLTFPPTSSQEKIPLLPGTLEPQEWKCAHILRGHTLTVRSLALSFDEQILASGSHDGTIKLWDLKSGQLFYTIEADTYDVHSLAFTPDAQTLVSCSNDQTIKLWNPQTGQLQRTLARLEHHIQAMALSPNGQLLATGEQNGAICLWELQTGALFDTLKDAENEYSWHGIDSLAFSPDGEILVSSSEVWHVPSGKKLYNYMAEAVWGHSVAVSPDGQSFAVTGDVDKTGRLVNLRTGEVIYTFKGHLKSLRAVAFRPDGCVLATGSKDGRIKLWNLQTGKLIQTIAAHSKVIFGLIFTNDGKTLISCAQDKKIKVWQWE